ncbi:DNA-binding response regulator, partial [Streptomyces tendae]
MRAGIRLILENVDDIEVDAEAGDGAEAAAAC